jgi:hypothetical protein
VGVVMSKASVSETKPMPNSANSFSVMTRSGRERPHRSSRQTRIASQLTPADGVGQLFAFGPLQGTRTNLLDLGGDLPSATDRVLTHGLYLERERLLVMAGDTGVEGDSWLVGSSFLPWPKTLPGQRHQFAQRRLVTPIPRDQRSGF